MPALPDIDQESWDTFQTDQFSAAAQQRLKELEELARRAQEPPPPPPPPPPEPEPVAPSPLESTFVPQPTPAAQPVARPSGQPPPAAAAASIELATPPAAPAQPAEDPAYMLGGSLYGKKPGSSDPAAFALGDASSDPAMMPGGRMYGTTPAATAAGTPGLAAPAQQPNEEPRPAPVAGSFAQPNDKWTTSFDFGSTYTGNYRTGTPHRGIDLVPKGGGGIGTPVESFQPGTVTLIQRDSGAGGLMVYVQDSSGLTHAYMHLNGVAPGLQVGQKVDRGTLLAQMGESGTEGSPHLHYEVRKNAATGDPLNELIDPRPFMAGGANQTPSSALNVASRSTIGAQGRIPAEINVPVNRGPTITRAQAEAAVKGTAMDGLGGLVYDLGVKYNVDPAFALSVARNESNYGGTPMQAANNNVFDISNALYGGSKVPGSRWGQYPDKQTGIEAFFKLITQEYYPGGQETVGSIMWGPQGSQNHAYAPTSENSADYPARLLRTMATYGGGGGAADGTAGTTPVVVPSAAPPPDPARPQDNSPGGLANRARDAALQAARSVYDTAATAVGGATGAVLAAGSAATQAAREAADRAGPVLQLDRVGRPIEDAAAAVRQGASNVSALDRSFDARMRELGLGGNTAPTDVTASRKSAVDDVADLFDRYQQTRTQRKAEFDNMSPEEKVRWQKGSLYYVDPDTGTFQSQRDYHELMETKRKWIEENNPLKDWPIEGIAGLTNMIADGITDPILVASGGGVLKVGSGLAGAIGSRAPALSGRLAQGVLKEGFAGGALGGIQAAENPDAKAQDILVNTLFGVPLGAAMPVGGAGIRAIASRLPSLPKVTPEVGEAIRNAILDPEGRIDVEKVKALGEAALRFKQRAEIDPEFAAPGASRIIPPRADDIEVRPDSPPNQLGDDLRSRSELLADAPRPSSPEALVDPTARRRTVSELEQLRAEESFQSDRSARGDARRARISQLEADLEGMGPGEQPRAGANAADHTRNRRVEEAAREQYEARRSDVNQTVWAAAKRQVDADLAQLKEVGWAAPPDVVPRPGEIEKTQQLLAEAQAALAEARDPAARARHQAEVTGYQGFLDDQLRRQTGRAESAPAAATPDELAAAVANAEKRVAQAREAVRRPLEMDAGYTEDSQRVRTARTVLRQAEDDLARLQDLAAGKDAPAVPQTKEEKVAATLRQAANDIEAIGRGEDRFQPNERDRRLAEYRPNKEVPLEDHARQLAVYRAMGEEAPTVADLGVQPGDQVWVRSDMTGWQQSRVMGDLNTGRIFEPGVAEGRSLPIRQNLSDAPLQHVPTRDVRLAADEPSFGEQWLERNPAAARILKPETPSDATSLTRPVNPARAAGNDVDITRVQAPEATATKVDVTDQLGTKPRRLTPEERKIRRLQQAETRRQRAEAEDARPNPHRLTAAGEPGEAPMSKPDIEAHIDHLWDVVEEDNSQLAYLQAALTNKDAPIDRPTWVPKNWSRNDVIELARTMDKSAFEPGWWTGIAEKGEQEALINQFNVRTIGSRDPTKAELREQVQDVERDLRRAEEAMRELLEQDAPDKAWFPPRAERAPAELPFDAPQRSGSTREPARTPGELERTARTRGPEPEPERRGPPTAHPAQSPTPRAEDSGVTDVLGGVEAGEPASARGPGRGGRGPGGGENRPVEDIYADEPVEADFDIPGVDDLITRGPRPGIFTPDGGGGPPRRPTAAGGGSGSSGGGGGRGDLRMITDAEGNPLRTTARGTRTVIGRNGRPQRVSILAEAVSLLGAEREPIPTEIPDAMKKLMPNLAKVAKDAPDLAAAMYWTAVNNPSLMQAAQGGVQSHLVTKDLARRLGYTVDDWLKTPLGKALNAEEGYALRATLRALADREAQMIQEVAEKGGYKALTDLEKAVVRKAMLDRAQLEAIAVGSSSTQGRALNANRIEHDREFATIIATGNERAAAEKAAKDAKRKLDIARSKLEKLNEERGERAPATERRERADDIRNESERLKKEREDTLFKMATVAGNKQRRVPKMPTEVRPGERQGPQMNSSYTPELLQANRVGNRGVPPQWRGKLSSGIAELLSKIDDAYRQLDEYKAMSLDEKVADFTARQEARANRQAAREAAARDAGAPERLLDALQAELKAERGYFKGQKKSWEEMAIQQGLKEEDLAMLDPTRRASDVAADLDPRYYDKVKQAAEKARAKWLEGEAKAAARELRQEQGFDVKEWTRKMREYAADERQARREQVVADNRLKRSQELAARQAVRMSDKARELLAKQANRKITDDMVENWMAMVANKDTIGMARFMRGLRQVGWQDRIGLLRYAAMLSATTTHTTQAAANAIGVGINDISRPLGAIFDLARVGTERLGGGRNVERERYFRESLAGLVGSYEGGRSAFGEMYRMIRYGESPVHKFRDLDHQVTFGTDLPGPLRILNAPIDFAAEAPLRILSAGDIFFRDIARGSELRVGAYRRAREDGYNGWAAFKRADDIMGDIISFPEIVERADRNAARAVTQESRDEVNAMMRFAKTPIGAPMKAVAFPFVRTPINVVAQGLGMTPAGYLGAVKKMMQSYDRAAPEAKRLMLRDEANDRLARATMGTLLMYGAFNMSDHLTGAMPETDGERSTLPRGWQPWSLRFDQGNGNTVYIRYTNLGSVGVPLAIAALLANEFRDADYSKKDAYRRSADIVAGMTRGIFDYVEGQTMLQGLNQILSLPKYGDIPNWLTATGIAYATSHVPYGALQRQIARATDAADRDYSNKPLDDFLEGRIPGQLTAATLPTYELGLPKLDPLGREVRSGQTGIGAFAAPGRYSVGASDEVLAALRENDVNIPDPPDTFLNMRLTSSEKREFQKYSGERVQERVEKVLASPSYQRANEELRQRMMQAAVDAGRTEAGRDFARGLTRGERRERILDQRELDAPVPRAG